MDYSGFQWLTLWAFVYTVINFRVYTNVEKFLHQPRGYQLLKITYAQSLAYNKGTRTF